MEPRHQRAHGRAEVALSFRGGRVRLDRLAQAGSAKALLPRVEGDVPEVVFLNTSGGLTGGDTLRYALALGPGAAAAASTQTAERAYRAAGGTARAEVAVTLGAGARLDWLPQETILFEGSALTRTLDADLAAGATLLMCEMLVFGRRASGETLRHFALADRRSVRREGRLVHLDPLVLGRASLDPSPLLGGAGAIATIALVAADAEARLASLRALLPVPGVEAAVSAWDGRLVVRALAPEPLPLRQAVGMMLIGLRGRPLPRVWPT